MEKITLGRCSVIRAWMSSGDEGGIGGGGRGGGERERESIATPWKF
jgi:hypothetical protein